MKKNAIYKGKKLRMYKDGNRWCVLEGINLMEGVAGFGDTKGAAIASYVSKAKLIPILDAMMIMEAFGMKTMFN